ncbi:MAG: TetR/AcrR family transcriptional regulator [Hyphomicrobiales bacterium]
MADRGSAGLGGVGSETDSVSKIVRTARELFARQGYERTTVKQIAERCGLTDAAILYHFKSKRSLFDAVLVTPVIKPIEPVDGPWDPEEMARRLVDVFYEWAPHWDLARVLIEQSFSGGDEAVVSLSTESREHYLSMVAPALRRYCGPATEVTADAIASLMAGVLIDRMLVLGPEAEPMMRAPEFRSRLERMVMVILPAGAAARAQTSVA